MNIHHEHPIICEGHDNVSLDYQPEPGLPERKGQTPLMLAAAHVGGKAMYEKGPQNPNQRFSFKRGTSRK